ncbi:MAG: hypothetical protein ABI237_14065 [Ginsengibacter sp.]
MWIEGTLNPAKPSDGKIVLSIKEISSSDRKNSIVRKPLPERVQQALSYMG